MLLASIGEDISPFLIEVLTGVSIGATLKRKKNLLYFNNQTLLSDLGISKALEILGFSFKMKSFDNINDFPAKELKKDLEISPAIIGPLDMQYLTYNPNHLHLKGADHFILAYNFKDGFLHLNDPAGYPHVQLGQSDLKKAWQAEEVSYRKGYYRYIFSPKRENKPSEEEICKNAIKFFKSIYEEGESKTDKNIFGVGSTAIREYADYIDPNGLNDNEVGHFIYFALPLGAKRASDYSSFFKLFDANLSELKYKQSELFGLAHTQTMDKNWKALAGTLRELAEVEERFKTSLIAI
jgi:hypothetical protein